MLIFRQELALCLSRFWVRKVHLWLVECELLGSCPNLQLWTAKESLCPYLILYNDRYLLCKRALFIIPFLCHMIFDLRATSYRLNLLWPHIEVPFGSLGKIKRRLMVPSRLFILELFKNISLNGGFLSNLSSFNERLYQTRGLLEVRFLETSEALDGILAFSGWKWIARKLGCKWSRIHLFRLRHTYLRDRSLFQRVSLRMILRTIGVSWGLIIGYHCDRCPRTILCNWSITRGSCVKFIILHRNFH